MSLRIALGVSDFRRLREERHDYVGRGLRSPGAGHGSSHKRRPELLEDHFVEGKTYVEIAAQQGVTPDALRKRTDRLLARLRQEVRDARPKAECL